MNNDFLNAITRWPIIAALALGAFACDQSDSARKSGKKSKKSAKATNAASANANANAKKKAPPKKGHKIAIKPGCPDVTAVPAVSGITALTDHGGKWSAACAINTEPEKQPENCTMVNRKEWVMVECKGDVKRIKKMKTPPGALGNKHYGVEYNDHVFTLQPGKNGGVAIRLFKGRSPRVWICFSDKSAALTVDWPATEAKPTKVALTGGPACN